MIWKKSEMELNTSATIKPMELKKENIAGKYGAQDEWWIKVNGDNDATTYTKVGDMYDLAFKAALQTDGVVGISKSFDKEKNRAKYRLDSAAPAPTTTPAPTSQPTPSHGSQSSPSAPVVDRKSVKIGMYAVLKAAGTIQHNDVFGLWDDAEELFRMVEDFTNTYQPPRQDIKQINAMLDSRDIVEDAFWQHMCGLYQVDRNTEITPAQGQEIIAKFDMAITNYLKAVVGEEEAGEDRKDTPERCPDPEEGPEFTHPGEKGPTEEVNPFDH